MKKRQIIGIFIISIGIGLLITPFVLIPHINSERIWKSESCMIPEGCQFHLSVPENNLIMNRYDVIVFKRNQYYDYVISGSIRFRHIKTNTEYAFYFSISIEEYKDSVIFTMIPGEYLVVGDFNLLNYEVWEHGILPQKFDWWAYLGFFLASFVIIFGGVKEFRGFETDYRNDEDDNLKAVNRDLIKILVFRSLEIFVLK